MEPSSLYRTPNALAPHYSRFRVAERLLLTGHSHQAWPDVGFEAQQQAWLDAADLVDEKWQKAGEVAERVRGGWRRLLNDAGGDIALGGNTHELVTRLLSARPLRERPRLVTTDGEFHTIRRQMDRLAEEGLEIVRVAGRPAATVAGRLAAIVDDRTACALISSVASRIHHALRERGVVTDFRGDVLRLGPAPYLPDDQLRDAVSRLGEALRSPSR